MKHFFEKNPVRNIWENPVGRIQFLINALLSHIVLCGYPISNVGNINYWYFEEVFTVYRVSEKDRSSTSEI